MIRQAERYKNIGLGMRILRTLMHAPVGMFVPWAATWYVSLGWSFSFLIYEINEDMLHLRDRAYIDICGFMVGMVIGDLWLRVWGNPVPKLLALLFS